MTGYKLSYILDDLTLFQTLMIYDYGLGFEETKAIILLNKYAEAVSGKKTKPKIPIDKPPPKFADLKNMFGDKVRRKE